MRLYEKEFKVPTLPDHKGLLSHIDQALRFRLRDGASPLRLAVTETDYEVFTLSRNGQDTPGIKLPALDVAA